MPSKLRKALTQQNKQLAKEEVLLPGQLGTSIGGQKVVSVPNRQSYVYVQLRTNQSELIQAFNDQVAQKFGVPVWVKREGNRYIVVERRTESYTDWETSNPYVPKHADNHIFDKDGGNVGGDTAWIHQQQFLPSLVAPFGEDGALNVFIYPYPLKDSSGVWKYTGNTGTASLAPYRPVSGSVLVLISLDTVSGNPYLLASTGTYIPSNLTGTSQLLQYLPFQNDQRYLPEAFIKLSSGTVGIGWNEIFDVRQFLPAIQSGTGGSGGGSGTVGPFTPDRVVISDASGTVTVSNKLEYVDALADLVLGGALPVASGTNSFHQVSDGASPAHLMWSWGAGFAPFIGGIASRGTLASPQALQNNDVMLRARARAFDGGQYTVTTTELRFLANEDQTPSSHGSRFEVYITPTGTQSLQKKETWFGGKILSEVARVHKQITGAYLTIESDEKSIVVGEASFLELVVKSGGTLVVL